MVNLAYLKIKIKKDALGEFHGAIAQLVEHLHGMQLSKAFNRNLYQGLYQ